MVILLIKINETIEQDMIRSVMLLAVISVISLTIAHSNAQAQQQASTGQNNTAAELARDPGDLFLKDKATPSQELKRDPGDLILTGPK
jgi:hypothetical protein